MRNQFFTSLFIFCSTGMLSAAEAKIDLESERVQCVSTEKLSADHCHVQMATIEIVNSTDLRIIEEATPLCPQWPPYNITFATYKESSSTFKLYDTNNNQIGALEKKIMSKGGFYGEVLGYTFLNCELSKLKKVEF